VLTIAADEEERSAPRRAVRIAQDVNIMVAELFDGSTVHFYLTQERQAYFVCAEGGCLLDGTTKLSEGDAAELVGANASVSVQGAGDKGYGHFLVIDMPRDD
jgi:redox-sensitive bicupin YhaK (pirin superfamily)